MCLPCLALTLAEWSSCYAASEVQAVLRDEKAASLTEQSTDFWIMAAALRDYVDAEGEGSLPVEVGGCLLIACTSS